MISIARNIVDLEKGKFVEQDNTAASTIRVKIADDSGSSIGTVYTVPPNTTSVSLSGNQIDTVVVTPTAGEQLQIIGVIMTSDASLFTATLEFKTSAQVVQQHFEQGTLGAYLPSNILGDVDEKLYFSVDNSADKNWFIIINYAEVTP